MQPSALYLQASGSHPGNDDLLALGLVGHLYPVPHLNVLLQDQPAAEGAFAFGAVPGRDQSQGGNEAPLAPRPLEVEVNNRRPLDLVYCFHLKALCGRQAHFPQGNWLGEVRLPTQRSHSKAVAKPGLEPRSSDS